MFGLKKLLHGNQLGIPKDVMAKLTTPPKYTPDAAHLQSRKYNLVFLYGNEMQGGRDHNKEVKPIYTDVFTHDPFVMIKVTKGQKVAPVVIDPPARLLGSIIGRQPRAVIKGELYQLSSDEIESLDNHYENGVLFDRVRVRVNIEHYSVSAHTYGKEQTEHRISEQLYYTKRVHMYVGRYEPFSFMKIPKSSIDLYKERPDNLNYIPRYYYSRQDWQ